jgi:Uri superfamily endonuclease
MNMATASAAVAKARRVVERVTRDLPLAAYADPPRGPAERALAAAIIMAWAASEQLITATRPPGLSAGSPSGRVVDLAHGPDPKGGTYVVVLRLTASQVLRIGKLGTFWLPPGYLLYVGSAFAAGGVAGRTGRHRRNAPLRWNVDHLKMIAEPVELWWSHNRKDEPVECEWAMSLAAMPGFCCPAPRCGANDCKKCPAHLFHTATPPSCDEFPAQVVAGALERSPMFRCRLT